MKDFEHLAIGVNGMVHRMYQEYSDLQEETRRLQMDLEEARRSTTSHSESSRKAYKHIHALLDLFRSGEDYPTIVRELRSYAKENF